MPEAKPRDTKHTMVIIAIRYFNVNYILVAQSEAEGILPIKFTHSYPAKYSKSIEFLLKHLRIGTHYTLYCANFVLSSASWLGILHLIQIKSRILSQFAELRTKFAQRTV